MMPIGHSGGHCCASESVFRAREALCDRLLEKCVIRLCNRAATFLVPEVEDGGRCARAHDAHASIVCPNTELAVLKSPTCESLVKATKAVELISADGNVAPAHRFPAIGAHQRPGASADVERATHSRHNTVCLPLQTESHKRGEIQWSVQSVAMQHLLGCSLRQKDATAA